LRRERGGRFGKTKIVLKFKFSLLNILSIVKLELEKEVSKFV
jgi:hypothetical protein